VIVTLRPMFLQVLRIVRDIGMKSGYDKIGITQSPSVSYTQPINPPGQAKDDRAHSPSRSASERLNGHLSPQLVSHVTFRTPEPRDLLHHSTQKP
jgi:hypothetical protein